MDQTVSDLILDIHWGATRVPASEFQHWAFEQIQTVLPFDSAVWVNGHINDREFIADDVSAYKQHKDLYHQRSLYQEYPGLLERMKRESGITLNRHMVMPEDKFKSLPIYREYFSKYDMEHALGTFKRIRNTELYAYVALYRKANGEVFTEKERRVKQALLLHMFDSYRYCLFYHFLDRDNIDRSDVGKLVVDNKGIIRHLSDNVATWLKRQWPEWTGAQLPAELKELGTEIVQEFDTFKAKIHKPKDDLFGIELHPI